ncbi:MAG: FAD-dependent oxidoreductase [Steroidobacteraceae bacterium]
MKTQARVVVIGGGAMGCSLVYHLTKLGWTDVVLVEKHELTAGSTWHAAGLCTHFAHNLTIMHMRAYSIRLYKSLLTADTGRPVGFHQCGALRVTNSPQRMDEFRHVQALGRFANTEFHLLSPGELRDVHPLADTRNLLGAFYEASDGYVDPSQATQAMAGGARDRGALIYRHNPVERIEREAQGEWRVHTRDGTIQCEIVVDAAGTWAREIGQMLGLDLPVVPMLHQYLVTDEVAAIAQLDRELPIIRDPDESWYIRQERTGLIVGPYERDGHPWGVDGIPKQFGMELLPPDLARVEDILAHAMVRVPALAEAGIKSVVNGPITFTPDANPLIGPAPGLNNAWLLTGSSMGVMEGGGAGRFLAEWMVGGEPPMDPLAVDPRRFGAYADREYRVARAIESFANQFAIHFPYEERPAGRPRRQAASYDVLEHAGARFGCVNGWERANWFSARKQLREWSPTFRRPGWFDEVGEECRVVRDRVGITDLSHLAKFEIAGRGATQFMATLGANRAPQQVGGIGLIHALTASGGVRSEFTVTRLTDTLYYLTAAAAAEQHDFDLLCTQAAAFAGVAVSNVTSMKGVLCIAGPLARAILSPLAEVDLRNDQFPWLSAREIVVAGRSVRALRISYVGELGWELHCRVEDQVPILAELLRVGGPLGASLFGAYAINSMRLEKGYRAWGADLSIERTPIEAGLGHLVRLDGRTFEGQKALAAHDNRPGQMRMALLDVDARGLDPFYAHPVLRGDAVIGLVTSGAYGHRTNQALALAYLKAGEIEAGSHQLSIQILDQHCPARILGCAPYDPGNERQRS